MMPSLSDHDVFKELPKVVVAHATFQNAISGEPSESALAFPIQAFLRIRASAYWEIGAEEDLPALRQAEKLGRPVQVDFCGRVRTPEKKWAFALETKIHDGKRDRLIQDLVKLFLLSDDHASSSAAPYFLLLFPLATKTINGSKFAQIQRSQEGERLVLSHNVVAKAKDAIGKEEYEDLFKVLLPSGPQQISLRSLKSAFQKDVVKALHYFKVKSAPDTYRVDRIAHDWSDDFACAIWRFAKLGEERFSV